MTLRPIESIFFLLFFFQVCNWICEVWYNMQRLYVLVCCVVERLLFIKTMFGLFGLSFYSSDLWSSLSVSCMSPQNHHHKYTSRTQYISQCSGHLTVKIKNFWVHLFIFIFILFFWRKGLSAYSSTSNFESEIKTDRFNIKQQSDQHLICWMYLL